MLSLETAEWWEEELKDGSLWSYAARKYSSPITWWWRSHQNCRLWPLQGIWWSSHLDNHLRFTPICWLVQQIHPVQISIGMPKNDRIILFDQLILMQTVLFHIHSVAQGRHAKLIHSLKPTLCTTVVHLTPPKCMIVVHSVGFAYSYLRIAISHLYYMWQKLKLAYCIQWRELLLRFCTEKKIK